MITGYTQPMKNATDNRMELTNEAFVLVYTYNLYLFTDFMPNIEVRALVGQGLVIIAMLNVSLNLGTVILRTLSIAIRRGKIVFLRWKFK